LQTYFYVLLSADIPMLIPEFTEEAKRIPTDEQLFHFTTRKRSYIHAMQQLVTSSLGPPQKYMQQVILSSITHNSSLVTVWMVIFQGLWYTKPWGIEVPVIVCALH